MSTLNANGLSKSYKKRIVVNDVNLTLKKGQCIGLLGPNGAGKTTFFYLLVGLIKTDSGTITMNGQDITALPMHKRAQLGIGYLPQEASVFRKLSVHDNILGILELRKDLTRDERYDKLNQLIEEFHLSHVTHTLGMSLSGGERRRVEIARALSLEPEFILLDEPFAGVDPISVIDIKNMIQHLCKKNIGVLITDHNVRETLKICDRASILSHGSLLCEGTPDDVLKNEQVRNVYLGQDFSL